MIAFARGALEPPLRQRPDPASPEVAVNLRVRPAPGPSGSGDVSRTAATLQDDLPASADLQSSVALLGDLLEQGQDARALSLFDDLETDLGVQHPLVAKAALQIATHFDVIYQEIDPLGQAAAVRDAQLRSTRHFYTFAQSGRASAETLLQTGRRLHEIATGLWENDQHHEANAEFERAVWCFDRYIEKEGDDEKRTEVEEDRAFLLWFLGRDTDAIAWLGPAAKEFPHRADIADRLAWCQVSLGEYGRAQVGFERIMKGAERGTATWLVANFGFAYCLAKKTPSADDVKAADAAGVSSGFYLGERGLELIEDLRKTYDINTVPWSGEPLRIRNPNDPQRRREDVEILWRDLEIDLTSRY